MSDDADRPDQIEGISTDTHPTPGDPELRSANTAPDATERHDHAEEPNGELADDVHDVPGDATPGTKFDPA